MEQTTGKTLTRSRLGAMKRKPLKSLIINNSGIGSSSNSNIINNTERIH